MSRDLFSLCCVNLECPPILLGCDNIIDQWFGIDYTWAGRPPRYSNKTSLLRLHGL
jgi:hypothetical protein